MRAHRGVSHGLTRRPPQAAGLPTDDSGLGGGLVAWHHGAVDQAGFTRATLEESHRAFLDNVRRISREEALDAAGGYRSILGIAKHTAAWSAVYYPYACEPEPRHWNAADWPRGLRDQIHPSAEYLEEILAWFERTYTAWITCSPRRKSSPSPGPSTGAAAPAQGHRGDGLRALGCPWASARWGDQQSSRYGVGRLGRYLRKSRRTTTFLERRPRVSAPRG